MSKGLKITLIVILVLILIIFIILAVMTRDIAADTLYHPPEERPEMKEDPADYGMEFEKVSTETADGLTLFGWFIPGENGATIMIQHGSPGGRQDGLYEAQVLNQAGYSVLLGSFRTHDECDGEIITFGFYEVQDIEAWHNYLLERKDVNPGRIGLFGESMGGGTSILYAATDPGIQALATGSAFGLTDAVLQKFIEFETDLPSAVIPLLAKMIMFWAERIGDFDSQQLYTQNMIADVSPVPLLIIHGGKDDKIGPLIGRQLFEAAAEPKELLWIEEAGHVNFEKYEPELYSETLVGFFDKHLLDQ